MPLIGYARVSTEDQVTDAQTDVLKAAGCVEIFREHMSGAKASRPELVKALARVRRGDVLVVAWLDRLARSLSHLLAVIAELDSRARISNRSPIRSTPRPHKAVSPCRFWAPWRNWSAP